MECSDDVHLLKKVKLDDFVAYEIIFKKYIKGLHRFAFSYVKNQTVAEEIVQEIFLYLWDKRKQLTVQTTLKTYLHSAVKNKCLNFIKNELPKQQSTEDISNVFLSVNNNSTDDFENAQLSKHIHLAIECLPKKCQKIFLLSRNAGLTYEEIAEDLNLSKKTVENQMGIALKKLRESLAPLYEYYKKMQS